VSPTSTPASGAGYALHFDGVNDFVELAATNNVMGTGWQTSKTVSLWVRPTGTAASCFGGMASGCDAIFGDRPRFWGISRGTLSGQDRLWIWNYDGSSGTPIDMIGIVYTPGEWVHVALVHSGGTLRAYRNGQPVGTLASGATLQPPGTPILHLGGVINSADRNWTFSGELDEAALWNGERTAAQIQQDMFAVLAGNEPGLRAYYRMSNGAGLALADNSGHGYTGSLQDGAPGRGVPGNGAPPAWVISTAW
jgi:hypothetical protein